MPDPHNRYAAYRMVHPWSEWWPPGRPSMNDPLRYLIAEVRECEDLTFAEHMPWCMRYPKIPAGCLGCNRDGTRTVVTGIEVERAGTAIWDEGYWKEVEAPDA